MAGEVSQDLQGRDPEERQLPAVPSALAQRHSSREPKLAFGGRGILCRPEPNHRQPESPIGTEGPASNLSTYDVWTLVAPFADSGRATRCYPVDSSRTS